MIHLIIGRQGSGKTLLMVKQAYEGFKSGKVIYSNVALHFPYIKISINDIIECKLNNAIVIIDEIHLLLPARNSMAKKSRLICDGFLSMVRKKGLEVYGSTQTLRKVDIRFREESDFNYLCRKFIFKNKIFSECYDDKEISKNTAIIINLDIEETLTGAMINRHFIGNDYFKLFNTKQI